MDPVISVVVPVYNQEKYIGECLRSLSSQERDQVEVILVDDGSTDRSAPLCQEWMDTSPGKARLIRQENRGQTKARHTGMEQAQGEYIVCVDSDDALLPGALSRLLGIIREKHPDVILFNATSDLETRAPKFSYPFPTGTSFSGEGKYPLYQLLAVTDKLNNIWAKCVKRSLYLDPATLQGGEDLSNGEDLYQSMTVVDLAEKVYFIDEPLYFYRISNATMSHRYNPRFFRSEKVVCLRRMEYAKKWEREGTVLQDGARVWICKILRDMSRKLFLSDGSWAEVKEEFTVLRSDEFYRDYYYCVDPDPNKRDAVLKSPLPLLRVLRAFYRLKPRKGAVDR